MAAVSCANRRMFVSTFRRWFDKRGDGGDVIVDGLGFGHGRTCQRVEWSRYLVRNVVLRLLLRGFFGVTSGDGKVGLTIRFGS